MSLASAAAIFGQIDRDRYDPIPLFIDKSGRWHVADSPPSTESAGAVIARSREVGTLPAAGTEAHLVAHPAQNPLLTIARDRPPAVEARDADRAIVAELALDVVFPIVHGPFGEDGTLQGLLELANVPYVGAGVLGSAVAMDKAVAKVLLRAHGLPVVPGCVVGGVEWETNPDGVIERIEAAFDYPLFVKPANLGSSVGVSRAADAEGLRSALAMAWTFDDKLVVEAAVPAAREIECSVLGNEAPEASVPGEVIPSGEFYDYEAKYLDDRSEIVIPAPLSTARTAQVRRLAIDVSPYPTHGAPQKIATIIGENSTAPAAHGARRFPARRRERPAVRERGEHLARVHRDQPVRQALGSFRTVVPGADRPPHRLRAGASPTPAAAAFQLDVTARGDTPRGRRVHLLAVAIPHTWGMPTAS